MARTAYSVTPAGKTWQVRNGQSGGREFPRKDEAVRWGREQAKKAMPSQLRIHGQDGRIQNEYTYGNDPRESKG